MLDSKYQNLVNQVETNWGNLRDHEITWLGESKQVFLYYKDGTFYKEFQSLNKLSAQFKGTYNFKCHKTYKGYIVLDYYVEKLSQEKIDSVLYRKTGKSIIRYDANHNKIDEWINTNQASQKLGIPPRSISSYMKRPDLALKTKGYYFKYSEE
jgi:hypothetical protein